jgi:UDP-glucose:(heptosyl)LPS alpha-1,3-glucosyltransferase
MRPGALESKRSVASAPVVVVSFRLSRTGGIERYTWEVAAALMRQGHDTTVLCGRGGTAPPGVRQLSVGWSAPQNTYRGGVASLAFPALARARSVGTAGPAVRYGPVGSLVGPGVIAAHSVHAAWVHARQTHFGRADLSMYDRAQLAIERITFRRRDAIFTACSPACAASLADLYGIDIDDIHVAAPGVDAQEFRRVGAREREAARAHFDLGADSFTLGVAANYAFLNKGVAALIRAAAATSSTLLVAGIPDRRLDEYEAIARAEGAQVRFLGSVANMRRFYAALDAFMLPSLYESYGMAAHEAMACGIATVVSRVAGIVSLVEPGSDLLTVAPHDVDDLIVAVELLQDDARRHGTAARGADWAHSRTWDVVGNEVARLVRRYCDGAN